MAFYVTLVETEDQHMNNSTAKNGQFIGKLLIFERESSLSGPPC